MATPALQFVHAYKSYLGNVPTLVDLSLQVDAGDFVFVTGPSGAGKSTLLRMVYNGEAPSRGQLLVHGRNVGRLRRGALSILRRSIGVVFQDFKLLARRNVHDNVAITLEVQGLPHKEIARRVFAVLKRVGLAHKMHHFPQCLSGGEQQRVAMARALVGEPQLLLADEPTGNLDRHRAGEIMGLLAAVHRSGTTVVVATHNHFHLAGGQARVVVLEHGRLVGERSLVSEWAG